MSVLNFNTSNQTFRQLLGNGLTYRVPPFQRDYSWTEDEWDDLWQDMLGLFEADGEPAHYLGYLVLQSSDHKRFDIIDGQQRITTISIMILASLSHLNTLVDAGIIFSVLPWRRDALRSSFIGFVDPVSLIARSKLELNRHNNKFYQTYLVPLGHIPQRNLNTSEHLLRKAFEWFRSKIRSYIGQEIDSGPRLASFIDKLADRLFFTTITVTDELNAFKVFETLNARGVRLSATDLLKNYLFSLISSGEEHDSQIAALEERWEHIVGMLENESFPEFLRIFWNSRNRLARKSDLFKNIRKNIASRDTAFGLIKDMDRSAEIYAALRDPYDTRWDKDEREALQNLIMFNVRQPLGLLLACFEKLSPTNRKEFSRILNTIAIISFRYNVICSLQSHDQERVYSEVAQKVSSGQYSDNKTIQQALKSIYPEDKQFQAAFAEKELRTPNSRNKKVVRYILFKLERQLSGAELDFESDLYGIEHILPESPDATWSHIPEGKQDALIYRLGNMTILERKLNSQAANNDFAKKSTIFNNSGLKITKDITTHYQTWDEGKIVDRQSRLSKAATAIWRLP